MGPETSINIKPIDYLPSDASGKFNSCSCTLQPPAASLFYGWTP
jgi:hypothetical protein